MENYLQKMFIDQATPALKRHSGGGGSSGGDPGGSASGGFIEVDELPTANVKDGVVYKVVKSEPVVETSTTYTIWMYADFGEGPAKQNLGPQQAVDSLEDFTTIEPYTMCVIKNTGIVYVNETGEKSAWMTMGEYFGAAMGTPVPDKGYTQDIYSETDIGVYVVVSEQTTVSSLGETMYGVSTDTKDNVKYETYVYTDGKWASNFGLFLKVKGCKGLFEDSNQLSDDDLFKIIYFYDTSDIMDVSEMFTGCCNLTTIPLLDTSNVTNIAAIFKNCTALTTIPLLDTRNVTNMGSMFYGCKALTTIPLLDTRNVTNMGFTFYNCYALTTIPLLDTRNVTNMGSMFCNCYALTAIPLLDTSSVTDMNSMFTGCCNLTTIPLLDTSNVTNIAAIFKNCTALTTIPLLDTRNVTNMGSMFYDCRALTTIPLLDTSSVTNMSGMFYGCRALTVAPELKCRGQINDMFYGCTALTTVSQVDTEEATSFMNTFRTCINLTTVTNMDIRNASIITNMFDSCQKLTEIRIKNIKIPLTVGSGTSYGHLLTVDSLTHLIYELRDTGSTKTLTVGTANLEKLASVYVKLIDITDEMRAEDDLIDEKLPFVVCESTDEGATLITEYVAGKNWALA